LDVLAWLFILIGIPFQSEVAPSSQISGLADVILIFVEIDKYCG